MPDSETSAVTVGGAGTARGVRGRYRRRELALADGARLVLTSEGTIARVSGAGTRERAWAVDDPEWPRLAHRFGIHRGSPTVAPTGRPVQDDGQRRR